MGISAAELAEVTALLAALPGTDWSYAGDERRPYGLNLKYRGSVYQLGTAGDIPPEVIQFLMVAHSAMPRLLEENQRLNDEIKRLSEANKKLRANAAAARSQKEN